MGFRYFYLTIMALILAAGCRDIDEGPYYPPDEDMSVFPGGPLFFDDDVEFNVSVPEDDSALPPLCPEGEERLFNNTYSPYIGGEESVDLEIVSISYFGCPHCALWADTYEDIWRDREDFRARVRIYFHHFPFSDDEAYLVHGAAHAAGLQNSRYFWAVHKFIYYNLIKGYMVSFYEVSDYVENHLDLDFQQWLHDSDPYTNINLYHYLSWDRAQATGLGIFAVPTIYICGRDISEYSGGRDNVEAIVDSLLD